MNKFISRGVDMSNKKIKEFFDLEIFEKTEFNNTDYFQFECLNENCNEYIDPYHNGIFEYLAGRGQDNITNVINFRCETCGEEYKVNVKYKLSDIISVENEKKTIKYN